MCTHLVYVLKYLNILGFISTLNTFWDHVEICIVMLNLNLNAYLKPNFEETTSIHYIFIDDFGTK